ncbi:Coenzyme F420 hydrogenase/dehydrogenase, beta subunit C-terminal domain [Bacteroides gallinaceum]|uniref:Coenzyme F420 hydrogenase/dehydrogenase, beta subunit C-terminal domain n=1 Tax=Bacteroides gallinaceum TaxID=1462571 RepID=A0ABT7VIK2_9BACE|nr:Coenzyme F420 hydrogenase/dehydrogenase, beta subunit C-terminal domain [Bacteroides gallinaceum]MDM8326134.1 Coenzyme F420 hydrogenase/dehydrogenase, beta subunit C-terminal domain [Bacteroides gallinaceum]
MIKILNKKDCCGCTACVQRCPKRCISMKEDEEGFLYPVVDKNICINCGQCEKVCPLLNRPEKIVPQPQEVLAVKNRNEEERIASSSGGVFIALAKKILEKGGVVFGAVFDETWEVKHIYAETFEDVKPMMGSKYMQSRIENTYCEAEQFLKKGREVLFIGSPCQIAGLHNYLRKDYPNLLSVDFLCHGVPSPGVWRRYLNETFSHPTHKNKTVLSSSLKPLPMLTGIEFRDKKLHGWKKYSFVVRGKFTSKADQDSVLLSNIHYDNPFMKGFLTDIYLRPSCYQCKCKNGISHSDLTIGDFWGINVSMPKFDDDKGTSLILINTIKGEDIFASLNVNSHRSTLNAAMRFNAGFKETTVIPKNRNKFFIGYKNGIDLYKLIKLYTKKSLSAKIQDEKRKRILLIKRVLKKLLGI